MTKAKPSILLIVVYLGRPPPWLSAYLKSCEFNPSVDWLVAVDWERLPETPANVKIKRVTKEGLEKLIRKKAPINAEFSNARKLCDFKVLYGSLFEEEARHYDFWGFTDLDIIYGNIRKFMTNEILQSYDVITSCKYYCTGHFTIIRNKKKLTNLYKKNRYYKEIMENQTYVGFDEAGLTEILNRDSIRKAVSWYHEDIHVGPEDNRWFSFRLMALTGKEREDYDFVNADKWDRNAGMGLESCLFGDCLWSNGKLTHLGTGKEMMYLHFNTRNWRGNMGRAPENNQWLITSEGIRELNIKESMLQKPSIQELQRPRY